MNLKLNVKKIVGSVFYYSGIIKCLKWFNNSASIILAYHRILPQGSTDITFIQPGMYVTVEAFEKHMHYISQHYQVISLENLTCSPTPKNTCIVTFDDGWADNFTYAFPILRRYGIPATVFISTNMIETNNWPWTDRISYYIHTSNIYHFVNIMENAFQKQSRDIFKVINLTRDKKNIVEDILNYMKKLDHRTLITLMTFIDHSMSQQLEVLNMKRPWLTWNEIIEMSHNNISFGAHTHNHIILTKVSLDNAREEMLLSKEILSQKIRKPVHSFSYPNGSYNEKITASVQECGFDIGVTTMRGSIDDSDNLFTLRRIMIHNDISSTLPLFACVLTNRFPFF